jgi:lysozyme family protein
MPGKRLHLVTDWSVEHALWLLESFNGLGYRNGSARIHSPYLWAGTSHYVRGKYVRDHVFSKTAVSKQAGCGGLIKLLSEK